MKTTDDRPLTTADLAGRRPEAGPQPRPAMAGAPRATALAEPHPFFSGEEGERFQGRWRDVQVAFVDDPRGSVEKADGLVAEVIHRLAEVFANERDRLESQWARGGDPSTEELRMALQRYRSFFERLLSV